MLEGLDTIDWSVLTHAHGPATDLPEMLRSLLSKDAEVWMLACATLHETIWHQGTVFPASAAVIPFLFELLIHADPHDVGSPHPGNPSGYRVTASGCAVSLLCAIATGEGYIRYVLRVDGEESLRRGLAKHGRLPEEALEISFTRHFYKPQSLRSLDEIRKDILAVEKEAAGLLGEIVGQSK